MKNPLRNLFIIGFALLLSQATYAQGRRFEKIQSLKIAYITKKVNLSSSQAEKFWPVYNRMENDLIDIRKQYLKDYRNKNRNQSDVEAKQFIEDNLDFQEEMVKLKRQYKDEFLRILSPQQLADLYQAEREFRQMLMQRLKQRKMMR
jgi:hypothetical protein